MAATCWIGVDPGSKFCGLALRLGNECLAWETIKRAEDETEIGPGPTYWRAIDLAVLRLHAVAIDARLDAPRIAVEGVRPPNSHHNGERKFTRPRDGMALAATFGAVLSQNPDAIIVPPEGNGRGAYGQYPENLVSAGEKRGRNWRLKDCGKTSTQSHARSAWMVAGKAAALAGAR